MCFLKTYSLTDLILSTYLLCSNMKLEYVDLYLIHWPVSLKPGEIELPVKKKDLLPIDIKSVWEGMEDCQKLGLAKSIGISNFSCKKLQILLGTAKIPPAVNQVCSSSLFMFLFIFSPFKICFHCLQKSSKFENC